MLVVTTYTDFTSEKSIQNPPVFTCESLLEFIDAVLPLTLVPDYSINIGHITTSASEGALEKGVNITISRLNDASGAKLQYDLYPSYSIALQKHFTDQVNATTDEVAEAFPLPEIEMRHTTFTRAEAHITKIGMPSKKIGLYKLRGSYPKFGPLLELFCLYGLPDASMSLFFGSLEFQSIELGTLSIKAIAVKEPDEPDTLPYAHLEKLMSGYFASGVAIIPFAKG